MFGFDVLIDAGAKPWLLEVNLDPSLQTAELPDTAPCANALLKASLLVDLFNTIGVLAPPPAAQQHEAAHAAAERARKRSPEEAHAAAARHVDAEFERAKQGGWRRLLPSDRSEHYARFVGEERREMHRVPFNTE
jgi:hypothetical protein